MSLSSIDDAWDFSDPAGSEARFRTLLEERPPEQAAEIQTQIARTYSLRGRFDEAHAVLDALRPEALTPRAAVRHLLERGRTFRSAGEPARARPVFEAAWTQARAAGEDALAVDAAHMVAIATPDFAAQVEWNERAIAHAAASPDPRAQAWAGSLLNNLAWAHHDAGQAEAALALFERCLAWHRERRTGERERIARWSVARCLRTLGRLEEALAMQEALAADIALGGFAEDGWVSDEIGENLKALGREAEARPHLERARALLGDQKA